MEISIETYTSTNLHEERQLTVEFESKLTNEVLGGIIQGKDEAEEFKSQLLRVLGEVDKYIEDISESRYKGVF